MQRLCGTDLRTLVAEDALRSVFPFAGLLVDLYVHGADTQALPASGCIYFHRSGHAAAKNSLRVRGTP